MKYKNCMFTFIDSMINTYLNIPEELCDLIIQSKEVFFWSASFRIWQKPVNKRLFEKMVKAGCNTLSIGLESGSEKVRKDMPKPCSDKLVKKQLKNMHKAGVNVVLLFIIGYPTETKAEFLKTIGFVIENKNCIESVSFGNTCHILPGSYLCKNLEKESIRFDKEGNWYVNDNNMQERLRRKEFANKVGQKIGVVS